MNQHKKIALITGGAGFIGSHLAERLVAGGWRVRVLDNLSTGRRANLQAAGSAVELVIGDIRDPAVVQDCLRGAEAVAHLAAVASVQASIDDPVGTHQTNFDGTLNLLEGARRVGVGRFLYASSAAIYGDAAELPVSEDAVPNPLSPYAADKLAGEHYLRYYARKHGLNATGLRFFNIYGPRQDPSSPYSGVISIFVERLKGGRPVTVFGDGRQTRDFVYVGDLADLLAGAFDNDRLAGEIVNVGRGVECSLLELLQTLEELGGQRIIREHAPARLGDILRSCADTRRLLETVGKVPPTPMREGLRALLRSIGIG